MIESATLAYSDEDFVKPRFQAVGLEAKFIAKNGSECYVAHNDQAVIVAFRGTESRVATAVVFSRGSLQSHHPSDVFAGATLGYAIAHYGVLHAR